MTEVEAGEELPGAKPGVVEVGGEIALVISPFVAIAAIYRVFGVLYLGPIAVLMSVGFAAFLLKRQGRGFRDLGFTPPASWPKTMLGALGLYVAMIVTSAVVVAPLLLALGLGQPDISKVLVIRDSPWLFLLFVGPIAWGTAAIGEELIARGFILNRLAEGLGGSRPAWAVAIAGQAVIFGVAHWWQGPAGIVAITAIGAVLALGYVKAGRNLWMPILAHGLMDSVALTLLYFGAGPGG